MASLIFLLVAFGAMYFVLIRPQQQRLREHQALVAAVEVGDEVLTSSGIYGLIVGFEGDHDEIMQLEVAEGVVVSMARSAVTEVAVEEPAADDRAGGDGSDDDDHDGSSDDDGSDDGEGRR